MTERLQRSVLPAAESISLKGVTVVRTPANAGFQVCGDVAQGINKRKVIRRASGVRFAGD